MKGDLIRKNCITHIKRIMQNETPNDVSERILKECDNFLSMPNQCAWTDRCVEDVIEYGYEYVCNNNENQKKFNECIAKLINL